MSRVGTTIAGLSLAFALSQATVNARTAQKTTGSDSESANEDTKSHVRRLGELRKGDRQWGLVTGFGISHEIFGGVADRQFLVLGGQHGQIFTNAIGPGFMKGHLEVGGEIYPVFLMFQDPTTYGFTFTILFRHYMAPASKVRPFFALASGTLLSVDPIPTKSSHLNFTTQLGLGVMWFQNPRFAYSLEYRLQHLSNNSLSTVNPGINSSYIQFGIRVSR